MVDRTSASIKDHKINSYSSIFITDLLISIFKTPRQCAFSLQINKLAVPFGVTLWRMQLLIFGKKYPSFLGAPMEITQDDISEHCLLQTYMHYLPSWSV